MIYLASPYSGTPEVMEHRYHQAMQVTATLMRAGVPVFSPIVHCHALAQKWHMPTDFSFWQFYNRQMIDAARQLWVLKLEGWEYSVGVKGEVQHALATGKYVAHIDPAGPFPAFWEREP